MSNPYLDFSLNGRVFSVLVPYERAPFPAMVDRITSSAKRSAISLGAPLPELVFGVSTEDVSAEFLHNKNIEEELYFCIKES